MDTLKRMLPTPIRQSLKMVKHCLLEWRYKRVKLKYAPSVVMDLVQGDIISESIVTQGTWETDLTERLLEIACQGGKVLVEVGANLGYFSLIWAAAAPDNRVFAFEPSPRNIDLLRKNVYLNGLQDRIYVLPIAIGNTIGLHQFNLGPPSQTGWGGLAPRKGDSSLTVVVNKLDDLFSAEDRIDFLKIDVEGADTWVLQGGEQLFRRKQILQVAYEQHKNGMELLGIQTGEAEEWLDSVGYRSIPLGDSDSESPEWLATPRDS
jgi:FkbM family methyltransferase